MTPPDYDRFVCLDQGAGCGAAGQGVAGAREAPWPLAVRIWCAP
jgi:hypothetical protein